MKLQKGKFFVPEIQMYSWYNWIKSYYLHDCIDVTSFIGQLLGEAHDKFGMKDMFCISEAAVEVACC